MINVIIYMRRFWKINQYDDLKISTETYVNKDST